MHGGDLPQGPHRPVRESARTIVPRALGYLLPYWFPFLFILLCVLAIAGIGVLPPLLVRHIIDEAIPEKHLSLLYILAAAIVGIALVNGLLGVLQSYLNNMVSQRIMYDLRNELYTHLQGLSLRFFTANRTGEIMSRLNNDVAGIQNTVTSSLLSIISDFATVVITLTVMLALDWKLTLLGISLLPLFIIPTRLVGRRRRQLRRETQRARADLNSHMEETLNISGFLLMKVFHREPAEATRFRAHSQRLMRLEILQGLVGRWFFMSMGLFSAIGPALIYLWGGRLVIQEALTIGTIVAFVAYLGRLYGPVSSLATVYVDVQAALALFERIFEYLDTRSDIQESPSARALPAIRGAIEFEDVSFAYVPGRYALKDFTARIEAGQMAALVGPSGAGKTTFTHLLPRLYDPTSGVVRLDGVDIREVTLPSLRSHMGVVTQEPFLFHASIRENLLYGKADATQEELEAACQSAQLHEFIARLPEGYDTVVGERGYRLSGGEKQRLAIARALLKDPRVLVMDEATSHLDSLAESLIRAALERLLAGRTSVIVAQRLSTILRADVILVIDQGKLVEQGDHKELLARDGLYAQLYETQFRQQEDELLASRRL
ncbi:MAG: ABC transporter ATP-binding protein [Chloroflexi bacterium]|nr:ABC transporter ATP-binding protein [Chloroflexota bacterium]